MAETDVLLRLVQFLETGTQPGLPARVEQTFYAHHHLALNLAGALRFGGRTSSSKMTAAARCLHACHAPSTKLANGQRKPGVMPLQDDSDRFSPSQVREGQSSVIVGCELAISERLMRSSQQGWGRLPQNGSVGPGEGRHDHCQSG
jgi:hypothetical protein